MSSLRKWKPGILGECISVLLLVIEEGVESRCRIIYISLQSWVIFYCTVKLSGTVFKNPARYIFLLILKQTLANLVTFSENYLATIDVICHCPHDLMFPWQKYIERHLFQTCNFPYFKIKQKPSCSIF